MQIFTPITTLRNKLRERKGLKNEKLEWANRRYAPPSPTYIKKDILYRNGLPDSTWVETGTFMGDTAAFLAQHANMVYTIEPDNYLYDKVRLRFIFNPKIKPIHGTSEEIFPSLLPTLKGPINFWLDGHFSGGFTHKGPTDCPVRDELSSIEKNISHFEKTVILIDDVRCFNPSIKEYSDYPDLNFLVDWARNNNMHWTIEHDIFIAKT